MKQPNVEKKINRDYPLSATPEPVGMQQERERQNLESMKGSALRLMRQKKEEDAAQKSIRDKKNDDELNQIAKDSQAYDNARYK